jgi:hypothetical protein
MPLDIRPMVLKRLKLLQFRHQVDPEQPLLTKNVQHHQKHCSRHQMHQILILQRSRLTGTKCSPKKATPVVSKKKSKKTTEAAIVKHLWRPQCNSEISIILWIQEMH